MRYPERFAGLCRVDPRQGEGAVAELRRCVLRLKLKGLMLHPWEEGYTVSDAPAVRLIREAGSLGVPVFVATGYPWVANAMQVRAVAERARDHHHHEPRRPDQHKRAGAGGRFPGDGGVREPLHRDQRRVPSGLPGGVRRRVRSRAGPLRQHGPVFDQGFELDRARSIGMDDRDRPLVLGENTLRILQGGVESRA